MLFVERGIISPKNHVQRMAINEFCSENAKTMNFDLKGIKKKWEWLVFCSMASAQSVNNPILAQFDNNLYFPLQEHKQNI